MLRDAALYVGYAVLATGAVLGTAGLLISAWWWAATKVVKHVWALDVFYKTTARIISEEKNAAKMKKKTGISFEP